MLKQLRHYFLDVHGMVIHAVQTPPPSTQSASAASTTSTSTTSSAGAQPHVHRRNVVGAFALPADAMDQRHVSLIDFYNHKKFCLQKTFLVNL